ncbi:MAG: hypothetical protein PHT69_16460 [Bacteroidales bacterium]|nr:hypothetical protein [Bacteroidales bacterium]
MKKKIILSFCMLFFATSFSVFSQNQLRQQRLQEKKREIETKKVAFISEKLALTVAEAQAFWPVYNEFNDKKEELMKENRGQRRQGTVNYDELSDEEVERIVDEEISRSESFVVLRKEFHLKIKEILPIRKVALFYDAEREFKKLLLKEARDERIERRNQREN